MIGSSNYARFVYDGDNSAKVKPMAEAGPIGSAYIETIFLNYFSGQNLITHPTAFDGRSDYGPFIEAGIPAGGLFSGAEGYKTKKMAEISRGISMAPFDPCYHRSCDDFARTGGDESNALALNPSMNFQTLQPMLYCIFPKPKKLFVKMAPKLKSSISNIGVIFCRGSII